MPLTGVHGGPPGAAALDQLALWPRVRERPAARRKLWFGSQSPGGFAWATAPFRGFLAKLEPAVQVFGQVPGLAGDTGDGFAFGLVDAEAGSLALFSPYALTGYGTPGCFERCLAAYRRWCELGMPGPGGLGLVVSRADRPQPLPGPGQIALRRGQSVFTWLLPAVPED